MPTRGKFTGSFCWPFTPNMWTFQPQSHTLHLAWTSPLGKLSHWLADAVPDKQRAGSAAKKPVSIPRDVCTSGCIPAYVPATALTPWQSVPVGVWEAPALSSSCSFVTESRVTQSTLVFGVCLPTAPLSAQRFYDISMLLAKSPACFLSICCATKWLRSGQRHCYFHKLTCTKWSEKVSGQGLESLDAKQHMGGTGVLQTVGPDVRGHLRAGGDVVVGWAISCCLWTRVWTQTFALACPKITWNPSTTSTWKGAFWSLYLLIYMEMNRRF